MNSKSLRSESDSSNPDWKLYWRALLDDLSSAPRFPEPGLWAFKLLPLIVGILVTIGLVLGDCDLRLQQAIYHAGENSWKWGTHPVWTTLYKVGPYLAIILGIAALIGLSLSWSKPRFAKWRRVYLFIALLLFLGPGVIVNSALKDNWGRPRPVHVDSMGGKQPFENVFVWNESREGRSFPCGHASTGYVLMAGFLLLCRHRRRLAYGWLIFGAFFGTLLGVTRMLQGGHFLTDVIWVALIGHYLALGLYYLLGLNDSVSREVKERRKMPIIFKVLLILVAVASLAGILLATPYHDKRSQVIGEEWNGELPVRFKITLAAGRAEIVPADTFKTFKESTGHGLPTSRVAASLREEENKKRYHAHYHERYSGWFHELETETRIELPWHKALAVEINNHLAEVLIDPGDIAHKIPVKIGSGEGVITLRVGGNRILWDEGDKSHLEGAELLETESEIDQGLVIEVSDEFTGVIRLVK